MNVIPIDPGNSTGYALFMEGNLFEAGVCSFEEFMTRPLKFTVHRTLVLVEMPRWYPHDHKDVNDLLDLSQRVGRIHQLYLDFFLDVRVELVWPRTWKGSTPKEITNDRTVESLTPAELALLPKRPRSKKNPFDHNMLDAVGLGLWKLGRLR